MGNVVKRWKYKLIFLNLHIIRTFNDNDGASWAWRLTRKTKK